MTSERLESAGLFALSLDLMAVGSFDGLLLQVNPAWTACLGWSAAELLGRPWMDFVHPEDAAATTSFLQTLLAGQPVPAFENRYLHKDGSSRWLTWNALPVVESRQIFAVARDVSGQKQHLERQRQNERLLRMAGAAARLGGWLVDLADGRVVWSDEVCAIHEVPAGFQPTVDAAIAFYAPESRPEITRVVNTCIERGTPFGVELEIVTALGNRRWVRAMGEAVRDAADRIVQIQGAFQDITDQRRAEAALRASEALFRTVIQSSWDVFHLIGADGTILYESPAVTRVLGYQPEEMVGRNAFAFVHPDDAAELAMTPAVLAPSGGSQVKILRVRHKDGGWRWVESYEVNLLDHPDVGAFAVNYRDITDRREAEESLRASEASLKAAQRIAGLGNWDWDLVTGELRWSDEIFRLFGIARDAFGATYEAFLRGVHPGDRERNDRAVQDALAGVAPYDLEYRTLAPDGTERVLHAKGEVTRDAAGRPVQMAGTVLDVTRRRLAEARLREQASLLDKAQDAILVRDLDHRILYWNRSAERRYGWTAAEAVGRSARELIYDDTTDLEIAAAATLSRGEWVGELRQRHKDGSPVVVEGRWTLVRDDDGVPRSILAVNTDLTERKKLERTEDQLRQAQKMEAIGSLAGGIAHDFNNLLFVILTCNALILMDLPPADPLRGELEEIKKAALRATELTHQLLAFSRKQILEPVVLDLNKVVVGVSKMLGRLLGEDIELTVSTAAVASRTFADAGQIEQVLLNLVVNARDAMPLGGNLTIETANVDLDASYAAEHVGVRPGAYVMLAVSDTGHGMDRATRERIFEPFFTTKDKSKGTGLGLSTAYGIVQQSGGHIWVYSEPGIGTTFKVYLPRSDRDEVTPASQAVPASSLRGTETILLVEDEEQVRTVLRTVLRRQGYHVLEAQNGGEAFLVCEQFPAKIHLLLTDVVMPRMSGRQLAERLAPLRPEMKVLYISGYTENTIVHHGVLDAGIHFLPKPVMPDALLRKIRSVLAASG